LALDLCLRRRSTLLVATVAAYSSYENQLWFAAADDPTAARLWRLSVDGPRELALVVG
jgi:hypothetical protein